MRYGQKTYLPGKLLNKWSEGTWAVEFWKRGHYIGLLPSEETWSVTIRMDHELIMRERIYYSHDDAWEAFKVGVTITETMIGRMAFDLPCDDLVLPQPKVGENKGIEISVQTAGGGTRHII